MVGDYPFRMHSMCSDRAASHSYDLTAVSTSSFA